MIRGIRSRRMLRQKAGEVQDSSQSQKSIYERLTGGNNPRWADKVYNNKETPESPKKDYSAFNRRVKARSAARMRPIADVSKKVRELYDWIKEKI